MDQPLSVLVNGVLVDLGMQPEDPLVRSVVICLFTWRRAAADDQVDGDMQGWWGDTYPTVENDLIGSRLWLLSRRRLDAVTVADARSYCIEALQCLIDDGVASRVDVETSRAGIDVLLIRCVVTRSDGTTVDLRFNNVWEFLNAV